MRKIKIPIIGSVTASPVIADGKLYISDDNGLVYVVQTGREFALLRTCPLGDVCMTSPALAEGVMIFRTQHFLIAVGE